MMQPKRSSYLCDLEQVLNPKPLVVPPKIKVSEAISLMNQKQQSSSPNCVLVVAAEGLSGIFTPEDVVRLVTTGVDLATTTIDQVMTQPVITCQSSSADLDSVWSLMQQHSISHVPILSDRQELIGIIDAHSLLQSSVAAATSRLREERLLFTLMLKDISELQRAQAKLLTSETLLAKAEKIAKIGSWEYNHETNQTSWSAELFHILGFTDYLAEQNSTVNSSIPSCAEILNHVHPEDRLLVKNTLRQGHRTGKPWQFNYRLLLPNGTIKYLESRGEPKVDSQGKVLKVLETIMDVSDRIHAEQSLLRSEKQLKLITDALPILIAYIDDQQRYRYNNRTYETWFGKPRSALLGLHIRELVGEDSYQAMLPYIETALAGKAVTFELQSPQKNGNAYWMNATYIPDSNSEGEIKGFFSMVEDITERKEIEKIKSEFVSVASHEMRTPLTAVHGVVTLLCAGRLGSLSPAEQEMAKIAMRNSERLLHLINDVLDLERMESGTETLNRKQCDSTELIQQAIDSIESMAQQHQVTVETEINSVELWVDPQRIVQTLNNILSNAIKFSFTNSKIWVKCQQQGDEVLFAVQDQGRGIAPDKLETIFERFQQIDGSDSRQKGGTGLGLAISRLIVEQHGGKIWVESIYGQGSTFFFTLPQR